MRERRSGVLCALLTLGILLSAFGCTDQKEQPPLQTTAAVTEQTTGTGTQTEKTEALSTERQTDAATTAQPEKTTDAQTGVRDPETEGGIVDMSRASYTYDAMEEDLAQLAAAYPSHFSYRSIGKSREGREIYAAVLGNPDAPKRVLVAAGIHARESLSSLAAMKQVEYYLRAYEKGSYEGYAFSELFERCAVELVPMINPDGVLLTTGGLQSLRTDAGKEQVVRICREWGKTDNVDAFIAQNWKANARGVDLNRNYPIANWGELSTGVIAPFFKNYKGPQAGSEPETQAMMAWVNEAQGACCLISYHTAGHVLYWDCGQTSFAVRQECYDLALLTRALTKAGGYEDGYRVIYDENQDASLTDWCILEKGLPALTVEMGNPVYPAQDSDAPGAYRETRDLFAALAERYGEK